VQTRPGERVDVTLAQSSQALPGYEIGEAIRYRVFCALAVVQLAWGLSVAGIFFHIVAYLMNLGSSLRFATTVVGVLLGLFVIGKPTMGALGDRIGGKNALGIALFLLSASIIVLLRAAGEWLIVPYFVFGVSAAAPAALVPLVLSNTLGLKRLGTLYGWLQVAVTVGFFVGPLIVGRLFDLTHNYTAGFEIAALIAAIGSVAAFLCTAPSPVTLAEVVQPQKSTI
jgi:MFS family permease